jgi:hypothetical protein
MLAMSGLHTRTCCMTRRRGDWRNGLALRTGRVTSVRRYLEGRACIVLDYRATYLTLTHG